MQNFDYQFNVNGNFAAAMDGMTGSAGRFGAAVEGVRGRFGRLARTFATLDLASNYAGKLGSMMESLSSSGISLDSRLHELSAVAGVTGESLKRIEGYARSSAKAFGIDASQAVESYKLILSQLSPELGQYPDALRAMGDCIATTSKLMGGDGTAAAEVLTTAMNQYGVSLKDPMKASEEMARMMNVMAAAGRAGSAELPAIRTALQQCGMAAKASNVSFEETNAAIQVLDKAGRKGSEGGIALRNVLSTLAAGRFLPEKTQEELRQAGISVEALADKSAPLKERLETLKPLLQDDALLSALFGRENANAARALVQGTESLGAFTEAVTGTASAEEQATVVMDSYAERQERVRRKIEDLKISFFEATGNMGIWISTLSGMLVPLSQLMPLLGGLSSAFGAFRIAAVVACRAVGVAVMSIPIIGWIAAAVAALAALGVYFWNTSVKFRAVLKGIGSAFVATFKGIRDLARNVFGSIGDLIKAAFSLDGAGIRNAISRLKGGFTDFGHSVGQAFNRAYNAEMAAGRKAEGAGKKGGSVPAGGAAFAADFPAVPPPDPTGGSLRNAGGGSGGGNGGGGIRNITVNVDRLVERFEIHTTNLTEDLGKVKDLVGEALLSALNDVNLAI